MVFLFSAECHRYSCPLSPWQRAQLLTDLGQPAFSAPFFNWNGGGTNYVHWDSCWASVVNTNNATAFHVLSFREMI
ncbi:MAG TPA: hypothetical protein VKW06_03525 [Candidatus Angelobacter sp.]|nr:hypothetical protein [Candidatus Angelobacter sp.]